MCAVNRRDTRRQRRPPHLRPNPPRATAPKVREQRIPQTQQKSERREGEGEGEMESESESEGESKSEGESERE